MTPYHRCITKPLIVTVIETLRSKSKLNWMEQHAFNWYATEKVKERMYDICKIVLCSKFYA